MLGNLSPALNNSVFDFSCVWVWNERDTAMSEIGNISLQSNLLLLWKCYR